MKAYEQGQGKQHGAKSEPFGASSALDDLLPNRGIRNVRRDANPVHQRSIDEEAELSERKSDDNRVVRWLQLLAAVGIPLVLVYLAFAGLVNPQFAEIRDAISQNRDAIISNRDAIAANASSIERLEARIDLVIEVLILASTNENITEAELRNILNAGDG